MTDLDRRLLRIAEEALGAIADDEQTSLRHRTATSTGAGDVAVEKPNVRRVARDAQRRIAAARATDLHNAQDIS